MVADLVPDFSVATDFLLAFAPGERWTIVAIEPDPPEGQNARTRAAHFEEATADLARAWMQQHGSWNLYYTVNQAAEHVRTTPKKSEITELRCLHVDVDLPPGSVGSEADFARMLARIRSLNPPPTALLFSGGGFQGIWRFPCNLPPTDLLRVEAACREVSTSVDGGDHCWNANRLLRLPGTVNQLNRAKRRRGRTPALAYVVDSDWLLTWSFDSSDPIPRPVGTEEDDDVVEPLEADGPGDYSVEDLPAKLRKVIVTGDASRWAGDRSRAVFYVVCCLIRLGWPDSAVLSVITEVRYLISAHVREQSNPESYGRRQIRDARQRIAIDWERDALGRLRTRSQSNVRRALVEMGAIFSHDTFALKSYVNGAGPARLLDDDARGHLILEIERRFGFLPEDRLFKLVVRELCRQGDYHPVRDYLAEVEPLWNRAPRAEKWLIECADADDTPFVRAVSRLVLVAAVHRARHPGCKFDEMLVLVNPDQGTDKSTALRTLARPARGDWFTDSLPLGASAKEVIEAMSGKWICESSDLEGMGRREVNTLKNFLSRQTDGARLAYREDPTEVPRQFIVIGTTNEEAFLKDTQNRRYWPVRVGRFNISKLEEWADQLWAEAAQLESAGESIRLDPALWAAAAEVQSDSRATEPWADVLADALGDIKGKIFAADVWKIIDKPQGQRTQEDNRRLGSAIRELGFVRRPARDLGTVTHAYLRGQNEEERNKTIFVMRDPITREISVGHDPQIFTTGIDPV